MGGSIGESYNGSKDTEFEYKHLKRVRCVFWYIYCKAGVEILLERKVGADLFNLRAVKPSSMRQSFHRG
jgi:hypothetical protein